MNYANSNTTPMQFRRASREDFLSRAAARSHGSYYRMVHGVDTSNSLSCWVRKANFANPYPMLKVGGKSIRCSRLMWTLCYGPIPAGMSVCHSCDNTQCINPLHLWIGTHKENMEDRARKGRNADHRGTNNGRAKLTPDQVRAIRASDRPGIELAREHNITNTAVTNIRLRKTWIHI